MKKLGIIGMGISGKAVAENASSLGYEIYTYDSRSSVNTLDASLKLDVLCVSPGIKIENNPDKNLLSIMEQADKNNTEIVNDIELYFKHFSRPIIAVTGSYGKSTVVSMIHFLLNHLDIKSALKGNIGLPIFTAEEDLSYEYKEGDKINLEKALILELSSAQLMRIKSMNAKVGVLLNIYPHHLDYHGSMTEYIKAKRKILDMSEKQIICMESFSAQLAIYYPYAHKINFETLAEKKKEEKRQHKLNQMDSVQLVSDIPANDTYDDSYNSEDHNKNYELDEDDIMKDVLYYNENVDSSSYNDENENYHDETENTSKTYILLEKNAIMAATAVCEYLGKFDQYDDLVSYCISNFKPLPHRMQVVRIKDGLTIINDSKSTGVHATIAAIKQIDTKVILLCGGKYYSENDEDWKLLLNQTLLRKIRYMITFGESADFLYSFFKNNIRVSQVNTVEQACILALEHAYGTLSDDITILFSPGCQSFDAFKSFEERGEKFREYIKKLMK